MVDFGLKRNGSGYYDETPYKAVMGMPKAGEVWSTTQDKLFLVLKNHGKYCTTLALNETNRENECLAVTVEYPLYTNPAMLGYTFNSFFSEFVKRIPDDEFLAIMGEVGDRLGVTINVIAKKDNDELVKLKAECMKLKDEVKVAYDERDDYRKRCDTLLQKPATDEGPYKQLYYDLIDRLILKGGNCG